MIGDVLEVIATSENPSFWEALSVHLQLSLLALVSGIAVSIPLAVAVSGSRLGALVAINVTAHFSQLAAVAAVVPIGVMILLFLARANGMSWRDLGLARNTHGKGLAYGLGAGVVVVLGVAVALALPFTREFFFNESYASLRTALIAALVIIPLQTVIPEELAFRGVLHGTLGRAWGFRGVAAAGSLLFGLWHVATSLGLTSSNVGLTRLFGGGTAHLSLIDSDDPLSAGLEIMASPPGKKLQALSLLSGGEQALTACALIFAVFLTNPTPVCVLDEVDAPLDDANIDRFCDLLDHMAVVTDTRYLIVTHNAVTMSRMHRLFGVTMVERGVSRLVSVDLGGAERLLAME